MSMQIWKRLISKISHGSRFWLTPTAGGHNEAVPFCMSRSSKKIKSNKIRSKREAGDAESRQGPSCCHPEGRRVGRCLLCPSASWGKEGSFPSPTSLASLNRESKQLSLGELFIVIGRHKQLVASEFCVCVWCGADCNIINKEEGTDRKKKRYFKAMFTPDQCLLNYFFSTVHNLISELFKSYLSG